MKLETITLTDSEIAHILTLINQIIIQKLILVDTMKKVL